MSLAQSNLTAKSRSGSGKGASRKTRAAGLVPAVVYGKHLEKPISISVDEKSVRESVQQPKRLNTVISLKVEGGGEHLVLLKEYQLDPVSNQLLHADFIAVKENEQVKVKVPLLLTGKAEGVTEGGILSQMRRELELWSLPAAIPQQIDVDVTHMKIATALHVNDIKLPAGVTVKTHVNYTIAVVTAPEVEKVVEVAAAAPAADGKAAPAADGKAAPAAAGAKAADGKAAPAAAAKPAAKK